MMTSMITYPSLENLTLMTMKKVRDDADAVVDAEDANVDVGVVVASSVVVAVVARDKVKNNNR
ncbi:hypothetical protein DFP93_1231 [Aneurinibacillus soli]|uniref:Uncharacterized protein n=1 Tax=Aneurinibacillus soli TaxID=1500254 RepID=A0A0U4WM56_9BACL|nr:hypothetical protein [Aneurinibacillus soli]PYE58457.1 hypothetical protein DFP93_1231 [Aneurinibacillus soli]BAU29433.1 hypothetical protein CB4_03633 [Aneurinibacillus soli]